MGLAALVFDRPKDPASPASLVDPSFVLHLREHFDFVLGETTVMGG
jgi:hypothetical protein